MRLPLALLMAAPSAKRLLIVACRSACKHHLQKDKAEHAAVSAPLHRTMHPTAVQGLKAAKDCFHIYLQCHN